MKRRRRWLWILLGVAIVAGSLFIAQRSRAKTPPIDPASIVKAERRPLEVEVIETGKIQPRERVEVKSKIAGTVDSVLVEEGAQVKKGQALIVLDPTDYRRSLEKADADVAQAQAELDFAGVTKNRAERSYAGGVAPRSELDQGVHDQQTKTAQVRSAEVSRAVAQDQVRYTKIVAPIDGTVIVRGIEPGETVVPGVQSTFDGKSLLTIANMSSLLVKVNLNQIDVAKVAVGRKATLTLDALPGHSYKATLTKVAPASVKLTGKEQEVFPVEAELETPDGLVKPGMTADVRIHLDARPDVLVVPLESIVKDQGRTYVFKVVDDKHGSHTERVEVTLGLRNDREVEILTGIDNGTRVQLRPPSAGDNETKF